MFVLRWIANSSHLSNHAQSMRRETQILCTARVSRQAARSSGRGTGHSRCGRRCDQPSASGGEAWSMAGQARRRRSALAALCVSLRYHHLEPSAGTFTGVRLPALTWAPFTSTSGGLRQVYLYLRPPTPALPLPAPPPSGPTLCRVLFVWAGH